MPEMRLRGWLVPLELFAVVSVSGAEAESLSRDSIYQRLRDFPSLVKGGRVIPHWMADGRSFWYLDGTPANRTAWRMDPSSDRLNSLFDGPRLRGVLTAALGHGPAGEGLPFATFEFTDREQAVGFELEGRQFRLDLGTYQVREMARSEPTPVRSTAPRANPAEFMSPDGRRFAFVRDWNIWLRSPADGNEIALTKDGVPGFGWTQNPFYTRPVPLIWSPDATKLLAVRVDNRRANRTTIVTWLKQEAEEVIPVAYPLPGGPVEQAQVCVLNAEERSQTCLDTGTEPDQILYPLGWRVDGSEVLIFRFDRFMKRVDLLAGNPRTGTIRVMVTDSQATFVEGVSFVRENLAYPLTDNRRFIWRSERDGWSHLYLYDFDGQELKRLTSGAFPVDRVVAIDEPAGWVYFLGRAEGSRPYDVHLYRVDLDGRRMRRLTEATGEHDVVLSPDKAYFLDTHSTVDRPPRTELRRTDGQMIRVLASADISALTALGWRAPQEFTAKAADGQTDLYGALYQPFDFDPGRKYPVIDLQYMGNLRQSTPHRFVGVLFGDEAQALTQLGFVVFMVDGRGTPGRSKAFQDLTYMNIGQFEVSDHVAVLHQLAQTRPYMDTTRVGITGYSWGGYYTLRALLTAPEVFKVGVAGAPVVDLHGRSNRIEPYMGTPQTNPTGYAQASNVALADRLQGKLLLAIGTSDSNVTFTHSMRMVDALVKAGKLFELIVLPGEAHILSPSGQRYYVEARAKYFVEHLKP